MNAAVDRAIEQLKEARETLNRAMDDSTLTVEQGALLFDAYWETHNLSLRLALASRF